MKPESDGSCHLGAISQGIVKQGGKRPLAGKSRTLGATPKKGRATMNDEDLKTALEALPGERRFREQEAA